MRLGKRSLLFGVHQFLWHPTTVAIAWWKLFGCPSWRELVCIVIHDWGYWYSPNMDGSQGELHTELGGRLASRWFGECYGNLCRYHSRHYAQTHNAQTSKLCWADKLSIQYEPWWFYIFRAWLSGELSEYRRNAARVLKIPITATHRCWFIWIREKLVTMAKQQDPASMPYVRSVGKQK